MADTPEPTTKATQDRFPAGIPYIVGNEGAERFSYYGMRAILYVYLAALFVRFVVDDQVPADELATAKARSTEIAHLFMAGVYAFPLIGAILADRLLGKYLVILWVSLIYCAGHAVLAIAGRLGELENFSGAEKGMYLGLFLIAVGSGGIKPCVSANVGDQFTSKNAHLVTRIYQIFYFIINFGSFFSTLLTPWLYKEYGPELAFGVPGILMFIATVVFFMGRKRFTQVPPNPGGKLGLLDTTSTVLLFSPLFGLIYGYFVMWSHFEPPKMTIEGAETRQLIEQPEIFERLKTASNLDSLPQIEGFESLRNVEDFGFLQEIDSTEKLDELMELKQLGGSELLDHFKAAAAEGVMVDEVPESFLSFQLLANSGGFELLRHPQFLDYLQDPGRIEVLIDAGGLALDSQTQGAMLVETEGGIPYVKALAGHYWLLCVIVAGSLVLGFVMFGWRQSMQPDAGFIAVMLYSLKNRGTRAAGAGFFDGAREKFGKEAGDGPPAVLRIMVVFSMVSVFWALFDQHASTWVEQATQMNRSLTAPLYLGYALLGSVVAMALYGGTWVMLRVSNILIPSKVTKSILAILGLWIVGGGLTDLVNKSWLTIVLEPAQLSALNPMMVMMIIPLLSVLVFDPLKAKGREIRPLTKMTVGMFLAAAAFCFTALLQQRVESAGVGKVHALWQILPYFFMTTSEVLVSVTGLEFAYTQAPRAMKSTIMGFWLLCVTFGNLIVAFLAPLQAKYDLSQFFWLFAALMAAASVMFWVLAKSYRGKVYLQE